MPIVYAHRGASGYAPENTMSAFELAHKMDADGIELDVQLTRDDHVVICHDASIDRVSNGKGLIRRLTLSALKKLDFGSWFDKKFSGEKVITLEEFAQWFEDKSMELNIEIKNGLGFYPGIEEKVANIIKKHSIADRTIVSSFHHPSIAAIKKLIPEIRTGALFYARPLNPCNFAVETGANFLHPCLENLDKEWVEEAHKRNIGINVFTVNTKEEYSLIKNLNVRGIFSNFIDRFR